MNNIYLTSSVESVAKNIAGEVLPKYKRLAFIVTASEIEEDLEWRDKDRNALIEAGFDLTDYTITGKNAEEIQAFLSDFDGFVMEGGNTFYLLRKIQESNCAGILRDLVKEGKLFIGSSAGSIVAGPNIYPTYCKEEAEKVPELTNYEGLGLIDLVIQPHWGSEIFKDSYLNDTMQKAYTRDYKMILLCDSQYIVIEENNLYRIVEVSGSK